jgi:hypothetical protein
LNNELNKMITKSTIYILSLRLFVKKSQLSLICVFFDMKIRVGVNSNTINCRLINKLKLHI